MKKRTLVIFAAALGMLGILSGAALSEGIPDLLKKHRDAMGGEEKIRRSIENLHGWDGKYPS